MCRATPTLPPKTSRHTHIHTFPHTTGISVFTRPAACGPYLKPRVAKVRWPDNRAPALSWLSHVHILERLAGGEGSKQWPHCDAGAESRPRPCDSASESPLFHRGNLWIINTGKNVGVKLNRTSVRGKQTVIQGARGSIVLGHGSDAVQEKGSANQVLHRGRATRSSCSIAARTLAGMRSAKE